MREIKFRFWSNYFGRFVVPDDSIFVGALKDRDMIAMQYTGLKDNNGVEIYEGDITSDKRERRIVEWDDFSARWKLKNKSPGINAPTLNIRTGISRGTLEVIGNIYQNPELLKKM